MSPSRAKKAPVKDIQARFQNVCLSYGGAFEDVYRDALRRYWEISQKYTEDFGSAWAAAGLQDAYRQYIRDLQASCINQDTRRYIDAVNTFAANVHKAQNSVLEQSDEVTRRLAQSTDALRRDSEKRIETEYRQFSRSIRELMSQMDPDHLDTPTMAWIGQAMIAAAVLTDPFLPAGRTRGSIH